ncbi:MAG: hypothetical protein KA020_04135 [Planctomycetes bacterium]|jgi:hypothetical protein|nr:hypothetical protein [Planctomycetota bacterium]MCC7066155.1 hypothetical protein [Planctomycetota bacterium]
MGTSRSYLFTALLAVGSAAVVFAFLPGAWPNPLPQGPLESEGSLLRLWAAAAEVDAACHRGDVAAFDAVVTPAHRERLQRQLAAVDRSLDAEALRSFSLDRDRAYSEQLVQPLLAGEVRGQRAVVAVQRAKKDGAQLLAFVWDGHVWRLDGSYHEAAVRTPANARAAVADAVGSRQR